MLFDWESYEYYIKPGSTDSRKSWGALAEIVSEEMRLDLSSKSMFLFCNRNRKCLKILLWDNGYWVLSKRLVSGTFAWPENGEEARKITLHDLEMILSGADIFRRIPLSEGGTTC